MAGKANVFISWSQPQARAVARALHAFVRDVVPLAVPFMSDEDIESGGRWFARIEEELSSARFGIAVLTQENVTRPWLMFEVGALAKAVTSASGEQRAGQVCPYVLPPLKLSQFEGTPLRDLHARLATKEHTLTLMRDVARVLGDDVDRTSRLFERTWPDLETVLKKLPEPVTTEAPSQAPDSAQVLAMLNALAREVADVKQGMAAAAQASAIAAAAGGVSGWGGAMLTGTTSPHWTTGDFDRLSQDGRVFYYVNPRKILTPDEAAAEEKPAQEPKPKK